MPFKSKAQRRKFAELLVAGKISDEAYERWNRETGSKVLVERVHPKTTTRRKKPPSRKTRKARGRGARRRSP
jgi:hypothetical protein